MSQAFCTRARAVLSHKNKVLLMNTGSALELPGVTLQAGDDPRKELLQLLRCSLGLSQVPFVRYMSAVEIRSEAEHEICHLFWCAVPEGVTAASEPRLFACAGENSQTAPLGLWVDRAFATSSGVLCSEGQRAALEKVSFERLAMLFSSVKTVL